MLFYVSIIALFVKCAAFVYQIGGGYSYAPLWIAFVIAVIYPFYVSRTYLIIINAAVTILTVSILVYYDVFHILPTWNTIYELRAFPEPGQLVFSTAGKGLKYWFFFIDIPALFFLQHSTKKPIYATVYSFVVIYVFVLTTQFPSFNNLNKFAQTTGNVGYMLTVWSLPNGKLDLSTRQRNQIKTWYDRKPVQSDPDGRFKGKSLVVIQVESLENFVINYKVDGQEITPNINRILSNSLYFQVKEQVRRGVTADAEHIINTGLYPTVDEVAFLKYTETTYPQSLPRLFRGYNTLAIQPTEAELWNWKDAMQNIGYQATIDRSQLDNSECFMFGIADKPFLRQAADLIKKQPAPSLTYLITATSHMPFASIPRYESLKLPDTKAGKYLQLINYADAAIGEFIKSLPADTVVVIYGDHEGIHKYFPNEDVPANNKLLPFIIYCPTVSGLKINVAAGQIDILPTIASLFGFKTNQAMGKDLLQGTGTPSPAQEDLRLADILIRGNYFKAGK